MAPAGRSFLFDGRGLGGRRGKDDDEPLRLNALGFAPQTRGSDRRLKLARLHHGPFTDRLVAKFGLPVRGWRGAVRLPE